jgi:hypothetical protein
MNPIHKIRIHEETNIDTKNESAKNNSDDSGNFYENKQFPEYIKRMRIQKFLEDVKKHDTSMCQN